VWTVSRSASGVVRITIREFHQVVTRARTMGKAQSGQLRTSSRRRKRRDLDWSLGFELAPTTSSIIVGNRISIDFVSVRSSGICLATGGQRWSDGMRRSLANLSASSSEAVTHMVGLGSSAMIQFMSTSMVSVFED
jgi:hypothetical protein